MIRERLTIWDGGGPMIDSTWAVLMIAVLASAGLWLSMRAVGLADVQAVVERLPTRLRRRVRWWQGNARHIQMFCLVAAVASVGVALGPSLR